MHALFHGPAPLRRGQVVLTQGTGGVSCFAIQLAAASGATVIATSSSDAKLEQARALGATHTVNYKTHEDWAEEVLKLTGGRGVDRVVEIGGPSTLERSLKATARGGVVALVGFLSEGKKVELLDVVGQLIYGGKTVYGTFYFTKRMTEEGVALFEEKGIRPAVGKVFEWRDAKRAFEALTEANTVGKIVIKVGE